MTPVIIEEVLSVAPDAEAVSTKTLTFPTGFDEIKLATMLGVSGNGEEKLNETVSEFSICTIMFSTPAFPEAT